MEAPLFEVDNVLRQFAEKREMYIDENYHNMPNRRLMWNSKGIQKLIEVSVEDAQKNVLYVAFLAWQDISGKRYGKDAGRVNHVLHLDLKEDTQILEEGYRRLEALEFRDLEFWTNLTSYP